MWGLCFDCVVGLFVTVVSLWNLPVFGDLLHLPPEGFFLIKLMFQKKKKKKKLVLVGLYLTIRLLDFIYTSN